MGDKRKHIDPKDEAIGVYIVQTPDNGDGSIIFIGRSRTAGHVMKECRVNLKPIGKIRK